MSNFRWQSLKTRVTLFTLGVFVVSIWSLAFYTSRTLRADMQRMLGEQEFTTASIVAAQINYELLSRLSVLTAVANSITPGLMADPERLKAMLDARVIFPALFNKGAVAIDLAGTAIADAPAMEGRVGANFRERDYFIGALKEGRATIGKPIIGKLSKKPTFVMAVPVRDRQGKVIGALAGVTDLEKSNFLDKLTEERYGKTGGYMLVAVQHRLIITATDKRWIMQPLAAPGVDSHTDRFIRGDEGYAVDVDPRGEEVLNASKHIPVADWNLGVTIPTAEAFAPIRAMQQRTLGAAVVLTLLAGALTWWMLRRQLSPMLTAVQTLTALANTDQPPRVLPVAVQDEIGDLIGSFNHLLGILSEREKALQASEAKFKSLIEHNPLPIAVVGADGVIEYLNHKMIDTFGYSPQDIPDTEHWWARAYPDAAYRAESREMWKGMTREARYNRLEIERRENRITCRDGIVKTVAIFGVWIADKVLVILEDITERKRQDDAIKEHNARLQLQKAEVEATLARVRRLEGLLSVCMSCKKIRTESQTWEQFEKYLGEHSDAVFSHGLCPECFAQQSKRLE